MDKPLILFQPTSVRAVQHIVLLVASLDKTVLGQHNRFATPAQAEQAATRPAMTCIGHLTDWGNWAEVTRLNGTYGKPERTSYCGVAAAEQAAARWAKGRFSPLLAYRNTLEVQATSDPALFELVLTRPSIDQLVLKQRRQVVGPEQAALDAFRIKGHVAAAYKVWAGDVTEVTRYNACYGRVQGATYRGQPLARLALEKWARGRFAPAPTPAQLLSTEAATQARQAEYEEDYGRLFRAGGYGPATLSQLERLHERHPLRQAYDKGRFLQASRPELKAARLAPPPAPGTRKSNHQLLFDFPQAA